jgi:hypothetical protein
MHVAACLFSSLLALDCLTYVSDHNQRLALITEMMSSDKICICFIKVEACNVGSYGANHVNKTDKN